MSTILTALSNVSVADWLQLGTVLSTGVGVVSVMLNRYAVANKRDRLAMLTSAAGNAAGRINAIVAAVPPGTSGADLKARLVRQGAALLLGEFAQTAPAAGATQDKLAAMIEGQLGQLPAPSPVVVATPVTKDASNV